MPNNKDILHSSLILACIDGSNVTKSVCDNAAWYASELKLPLSLLHVINVPKSNRHDLSGAIGMDSRRHLLDDLARLDEQQARLANRHGDALVKDAKAHVVDNHQDLTVHTHLRHSKLLPAIEHFGEKPRLIVMGRRGTDHQNETMTIGSQIESVVRAIHCPILICSEDFTEPTSYMLAFDGSPTAKKAVDIICNSDLPKNMTGHLVMVGHQDTKHENELSQAQQQLRQAGLDATTHIIDAKQYDNDVVTALTAFRKDNNLSMTIIGAYGHSKFRQFFVGSTTTKLLTKTTAPVLLLR